MPELEMKLDLPPAPPAAPTPGWLSIRLNRWLILALVLALGTAAALAVGRTIDRRPAQDRAAIAVAMAYVDASNAHDWPAIQRTVTADAELIFLGPRGQLEGTYSGKAWEDAAASTMEGFHLAVLTEPIVARGSQVSFVAHMTRTGDDRVDLHVVDLVRENGVLKIQQILVITTPEPLDAAS